MRLHTNYPNPVSNVENSRLSSLVSGFVREKMDKMLRETWNSLVRWERSSRETYQLDWTFNVDYDGVSCGQVP